LKKLQVSCRKTLQISVKKYLQRRINKSASIKCIFFCRGTLCKLNPVDIILTYLLTQMCNNKKTQITDNKLHCLFLKLSAGFPLYFGSKIKGLFKDFQGPWSYIFKDQFSTEICSMNSITAIFNICFCDYGTVFVDKNKTSQLLAIMKTTWSTPVNKFHKTRSWNCH